MVDLLISSNICRYTEFRAVDKVLTVLNGKLDIVPGSRSDIFTKKNVTIIEKRLLMKFITQCVEEDKREDDFKQFPEEGKFVDLMKQQRLTENLIHYILYSMCMGSHEMTFSEGLERIKTYLTSIGRYGNTPFLFPMFGCGEIPQCFCRLCAVFGGIYWLGKRIDDVQTIASENPEEQIVKIKFGDEEISTKKLVCGLGSKIVCNQVHEFISRAVIITTSPVGGKEVNNEKDGGGVVLLYHPIEGRPDGVTMIQLSHYSSCISNGLCKIHFCAIQFMSLLNFHYADLVHLSTTCKDGAQQDFQQFIETFFREDFDPQCEDDTKPTIIYSAFFEIPGSVKEHDYVSSQDGPIYSCCGPFAELDYDEAIRQSRELYKKMYPEDEFLPKAPEPEEIVIGDEDAGEGTVNLGVLADLIDDDENKAEIVNDEDQKSLEHPEEIN